MKPVLAVRDLSVEYRTGKDWHRTLDGVSFSVAPGEIVGVIGESGCGKSTLAKALMRMLPASGRIPQGHVELDGRSILQLSEPDLRKVRWSQIAMVFQSALNALNPIYRVGDQIAEALRLHAGMNRAAALARVRELLHLVGVDPDRSTAYPHELSGGMRQRICIAMALSLHPKLLVADEPTTALDVITQARVLSLLRRLRTELGISVILISHDLSVVAQTCDRVVVLYGGRVVEIGPTSDVLRSPVHPYTMGLRNAFPTFDANDTLISIPGSPPSPGRRPQGCVFSPRCPFAMGECLQSQPGLLQVSEQHAAACPPGLERATELQEHAALPTTWAQGGIS